MTRVTVVLGEDAAVELLAVTLGGGNLDDDLLATAADALRTGIETANQGHDARRPLLEAFAWRLSRTGALVMTADELEVAIGETLGGVR